MSNLNLIKELRERTGAGMMDCKRALQESSDDLEKAAEYLRKKGIAKAAKRAGRTASEGIVHSYIHTNNKVGVLLELNCETDFVAKTDDFRSLAHNLALQVAAANPRYLDSESIPQQDIDKEREVLKSQAENEGKKGPVIDKIVDGRIRKFYEESCLLNQVYVKNQDQKVDALIKESIAKLGENITVGRFTRFQVGETKKATQE